MLSTFVVPPPLRPGDRIRIIAPSSPFDRTLFFRGLGFLSERYHVELGAGVLDRRGFLAGDDETRLASLKAALADDGVRAVLAARGGYGAGRIVHRVRWDALRSAPKWIIGFSDVTAVHVEAQGVGVCSMHAENAAGLGRGDAVARAHWIDALERPTAVRTFPGLTVWASGSARGPLVGGNLTVLFTAHAAGRLRLPEGCILALEDVTEASYRIDRMLTALLVSRALDRVAGVVLGDFTDCSAGVHRVAVEAVLAERLGTLGVPVLTGLPFGHGRPNVPLPLGMPAHLDANAGSVVIGSASA